MLPTLLKSRATVRFQDCDPYGHLYNAKYIDYFMNAREDQVLAHYNLDIYALSASEGIGWVVAQNQIAYLQPAMLMEQVWITSRLIDYNQKVITVEFNMWDTQESSVKAIMWSRFVHFDLRTRRSTAHAPHYEKLFTQVLNPVDTPSFDMRVKQVRG